MLRRMALFSHPIFRHATSAIILGIYLLLDWLTILKHIDKNRSLIIYINTLPAIPFHYSREILKVIIKVRIIFDLRNYKQDFWIRSPGLNKAQLGS